MSEAPERVYIAWLYNDSGYAYDVTKGYSSDIGPEYIRADLHEARAKDEYSKGYSEGKSDGYDAGYDIGYEDCEMEESEKAHHKAQRDMPKFNHAFDFAVEVVSEKEDSSDVTPKMLIAALRDRINRLEAEDKGAGMLDACGLLDTHPDAPVECDDPWR